MSDNIPHPQPPKCGGYIHNGKYQCRDYATWAITYAPKEVIANGGDGFRVLSCGKHLNQICLDAVVDRPAIEFAEIRQLT